MQPLSSIHVRTEALLLTKLEVWWYLVVKLGPNLSANFEQVKFKDDFWSLQTVVTNGWPWFQWLITATISLSVLSTSFLKVGVPLLHSTLPPDSPLQSPTTPARTPNPSNGTPNTPKTGTAHFL